LNPEQVKVWRTLPFDKCVDIIMTCGSIRVFIVSDVVDFPFRNKFGVDPAKRFAEPLQRLKDWGFLAIEGDLVLLNREGLLQVDRLLHEFFLPQHRNARYA